MPYPIHGNCRCIISNSLKQKKMFKKVWLCALVQNRPCLFFRPGGLDIVLPDVVEKFLIFSQKFLSKNVFWRRQPARPETLPKTFQNVKNSPAPPSTDMFQKLDSKPTDLIRNENIQSTATPCRTSGLSLVAFSGTTKKTLYTGMSAKFPLSHKTIREI